MGKIEIHFAVGVPPGFDQVAIERAVEPDGIALGGEENLDQALGGGVPEAGEINNVPAVGEQDAVAAILREFFLEEFGALLVPVEREAIVGGRL